MSKKLILLTCITLVLYILTHWYVITRLSQLLSVFPTIGLLLQSFIFALGLAYPVGRLANMRLPGKLGDSLIIVGCYWLGALFYASLLLLLLNGIYMLDHYCNFLPEWLKSQSAAGWLIIALSGAAVVIGAFNARNLQVKRLEFEVDKQCIINPLTIVCVSDIHLGLLVGVDRLKPLISLIQQLNPDLVLFPGDILDETVGVFSDCRMADEFRRLSPRLGVYGCLGNHEYIWGSAEKSMVQLTQAGITILRDEYTVIDESFIIVGRDDVIRRHFAEPRHNLPDILHGIDSAMPLILLDHTPEELNIGPKCGADLQLLGHTHSGQIFPFNYLTSEAFEIDGGYIKHGKCHTVVSSGFGTWGPPLRIGNKPEILHITLKFPKDQT